MKKIILIAIVAMSVTVACKTKSAMVPSASNNTMEAQLKAVNERFPNTTMAELEKGKSIYTGACTKCHGTKDVTTYTEPKLLGIVDIMAVKAKITDDEKLALIKFAVGVRATSK